MENQNNNNAKPITIPQLAKLFGISRQRAHVILNTEKNNVASKMMSVLLTFDENTLKEKIEKLSKG